MQVTREIRVSRWVVARAHAGTIREHAPYPDPEGGIDMEEILLAGHITRVHLHDGQLEVTMNGRDIAFPVGASPEVRPAAPRAPQTRRRQVNGHTEHDDPPPADA